MFDRRAAIVLTLALTGGGFFAAAVTSHSLLEPVPEPYFGLEAPATATEPVAAPAGASAAVEVGRDRPPVGGFADMAAALERPPERLALAESLGPIFTGIQSQALPTAASGTTSRVEHAAAPAASPQGQALGAPTVAEPELLAVEPVAAPEPPPEELKALVDRVRRPAEDQPAVIPADPPPPHESPPPPGPAPLPGEEWNDPERVNWSDAAADQGQATGSAAASLPVGRRRGIFADRRPDGTAATPQAGPLRAGRLLDRLRGDRRPLASGDGGPEAAAAAGTDSPAITRWPDPARLREQFDHVAQASRGGQPGVAAVAEWVASSRARLDDALATAGPADPRADAALLSLGEMVPAGMTAGDGLTDPGLASLTRRAALAVARRVAAWRAAVALCAELAGTSARVPTAELDGRLAVAQLEAETARLLDALERFESASAPADAAAAKAALQAIAAAASSRTADLARTIADHYMAPNVRVAVHRRFVERMLPEATVTTSPMQDFVLGRKVRGTSTVEQTMAVAFVPDADKIRLELLVRGEVASRTVTDAGPAAIHSRGEASFTVRKPVSLSAAGLAFGTALGSASNQSQLGTIQTSFDGVPLMGSLMQRIVRNQADESKPQAAREVNEKIITRACRQVDEQSEPKFDEMAEKVRERIWNPMVALGLEPTAVALESTSDQATVRLRLAAAAQLAAHTPRPRAPAESLLGVQVHESTLNNGSERLDLAGRTFPLEDLIRMICRRLGLEPRIPDDLPEGVSVSFAAEQPLRIEFRDGLVRIRLALDAIESGRRSWYDVVAEVAYQPTSSGPQVLLERSGQVHLADRKALEIPLRTIFAKIFPKERPIALLPASVVKNPRLADLRAVQVVSTDGWFALALDGAAEPPAATSPAVRAPQQGRARLPAARAPAAPRR
jgi:hypothetical protein